MSNKPEREECLDYIQDANCPQHKSTTLVGLRVITMELNYRAGRIRRS
jgi:hypothetical protein